jgi:hypothetical protein
MKTRKNAFTILLIIFVASSIILSSCAPKPTPAPTATLKPVIAPTAVPIPLLSLEPGQFYFSVDGKQSFIFSRNVAGYQQTDYQTFLDWSKAGGSRFVRIQLDSLGMGYTSTGNVDLSWAAQWDGVFDKAEADGIYILPVFSGWFDWNAGTGYSTWKSNPLNAVNGGPVQSPAELFQKSSATQIMWMEWMQTLVQRWQGRKNILAWEVFSEVNLASNPTESAGIDFVNTAAAHIRAADPSGRPVTASIADTGTWPNFYRQASIDFINLHPYPPSAQLDRAIITQIRAYLAGYNRPVLIGESGLSADTPDSSSGKLSVAPNAPLGVRHAIWAGVVSGAMNGRALYWEDSFGIYFSNLGIPWMQKYKTEELPAVNFVNGVNFSGFKPLTSTSSSFVWGAAVGNESMVLGWYRDAGSEPPDWNLQPVVTGQTVTITVPGLAADWKVDFYDTRTGTDIVASAAATRNGNSITVSLPDFTDDIAFKLTSVGEAVITSAPAAANTDPITGKWSGTITNSAGTFSTPVEISILSGCEPGKVCGTFAAPQLPCSGDLFLKEITAGTFAFIEQNVSGAATCTAGGYEHLKLLADGTLSYKFSFAPPSVDTSNGILQRK